MIEAKKILQRTIDSLKDYNDDFYKEIGDVVYSGKVEKNFYFINEDNNVYKDKDVHFKHILLSTRKYRDYGCAVYKLIKNLENMIKKANILYWRCLPKVIEDFSSNYKTYKGVVRFTLEEGAKK